MTFIESWKDHTNRRELLEASDEAEKNQKMKEMIETAKLNKQKAVDAKEAYDNHTELGDDEKAKIELLKYKKYRATAESLAAEVQLMKLNVDVEKPKAEIGKDKIDAEDKEKEKKKDDKSNVTEALDSYDEQDDPPVSDIHAENFLPKDQVFQISMMTQELWDYMNDGEELDPDEKKLIETLFKTATKLKLSFEGRADIEKQEKKKKIEDAD